jgi:cyclic pyranopterin phosphate synthase
MIAGKPGWPIRAHHQRHPARGSDRRPCHGGSAADHGEPDTLRRDRFVALARFDEIDRVKAGMQAAHRVFGAFKIDSVIIKGVNDDEPVDPSSTDGRSPPRLHRIHGRGGATQWSAAHVMSRQEILAALSNRYGPIEPIVEPASSAPADRYRLADGTTFGIIASTTDPFCRSCDRSRLTADGLWFLCLYATEGLDLRKAVRSGAGMDELKELVARGWRGRDDRGAEVRLALGERRAFVPINALRQNPHLEMHTRGG